MPGGERNGGDLDDGEVESARAQVQQRADGTLVQQRRQRDDKRLRRQRSRRQHVDVLPREVELALQQEASAVAAQHPDWPRFRVGVNSGIVATGVVGGERGPRKHGVVGDAVNLAARLQSAAPVGEVLIGEETYRRLPDGTLVEPKAELRVKGKEQPVAAYVLRSLP